MVELKYFFSNMAKFKSAPKVLKFGMHLVHRILRPMVKRWAQSDHWFSNYRIFGPFSQKRPKKFKTQNNFEPSVRLSSSFHHTSQNSMNQIHARFKHFPSTFIFLTYNFLKIKVKNVAIKKCDIIKCSPHPEQCSAFRLLIICCFYLLPF